MPMEIQDFATDFLGGMLHVRWKAWLYLFSLGESTTSSVETRDYTIYFEEFSTQHLHRDRVFHIFSYLGSLFAGFLQILIYFPHKGFDLYKWVVRGMIPIRWQGSGSCHLACMEPLAIRAYKVRKAS